uniref:Sodium channel regulatory subunit beta-3 n=1 Tax=Pseudonaja textilis TaxID=8673 RepID=A0A670Z9C6_PSETE
GKHIFSMVPSETEAVQGSRMKLMCISCMKREEVLANTIVKWFYKPEGGQDVAIYEFNNEKRELESPFQGRLEWNGSADMQDVSISVLNISMNDSGIYTCNVTREFLFETHRPIFTSSTLIHLTVLKEGKIIQGVSPFSRKKGVMGVQYAFLYFFIYSIYMPPLLLSI